MKTFEAAQHTANLAAAVAHNVPYQGRKVQRRKSESRRQAILEATLRIIVRDGVRAVRHRAVAAEAVVPLSATTYYFANIEQLIADSFALYLERSAEQLSEFWRSAPKAFFHQGQVRDAKASELLDEHLAVWLSKSLLNSFKSDPEHLLVGQAFLDEALRDASLAAMLAQHERVVLSGFAELLKLLGNAQPEQGAQLLVSVLAQLEYQLLLAQGRLPSTQVKARLKHCVSLLLSADCAARVN